MNFNEFFEEMERLHNKISEELFRDFKEILKNHELEGEWSIEPIESDGVEGFIARGFFRTPNLNRSAKTLADSSNLNLREPLYDIEEFDDAFQIIVELPGAEKDDIKIERKGDGIEIKSKNFYIVIPLPEKARYGEDTETEFKNGILTIKLKKIKG